METRRHIRIPKWIRYPQYGGETYAKVSGKIHGLNLHTVCESARCPNRGECWGEGTATVILLGDTCTRNCRFCAVNSGHPNPPDPDEPKRVALAAKELKLKYVVLTSVDRDDLPDLGAGHFVETARSIKEAIPNAIIEVLTPDFQGREDLIAQVATSPISVFAHNVEVVRRLTPKVRDRRCSYDLSIDVLKMAKRQRNDLFTKTSLMVGLGETMEEIYETLADLHKAKVDMITIGQYLQPTRKHVPVQRYYTPEEFKNMEKMARDIGFRFVASGPLVRSSYRAGELFVEGKLKPTGNYALNEHKE